MSKGWCPLKSFFDGIFLQVYTKYVETLTNVDVQMFLISTISENYVKLHGSVYLALNFCNTNNQLVTEDTVFLFAVENGMSRYVTKGYDIG